MMLARSLLASFFDTFSILFRKGVFQGSVARLGSLLQPFWITLGTFLAPFLCRRPFFSAPTSVKHQLPTADTRRRKRSSFLRSERNLAAGKFVYPSAVE